MADHDVEVIEDLVCLAKKKVFDADGNLLGRVRKPRMKIVKLSSDAMVPEMDDSGCWDIYSEPGPNTYFLAPGEKKILKTKLCIILPDGYVGWCRSYQVCGENVVSVDRLITSQDACVDVEIEVVNYGELGFFARPFTKLCDMWIIPCPVMKCVVTEVEDSDDYE